MTFDEKKRRALALMEEKKMWRSSCAPLLTRLLWKLGINVPPPPFAPFWLNVLCFGGFFGSLWGTFMWFTLWKSEGCGALMALQTSCFAGLFFGLWMALYYYWLRKVKKLPGWGNL
ncbi:MULTISPECIES: DUF6404 family protein [unclassified Serratia (in: enterobacteria)]|uniref:DUF6404 family protein n=1 Tax=unclassified Serratia (in: enterobacteria) TaxID=2647522 RepID=UPI0030762459